MDCQFTTSESWTILSPIELSIKRKIEAVGTPLKDWDIHINYGIKTGCNEAFIINAGKRQEILNNCRDDEERRRTDELIRPILRGRDIKRYGYDWANLYLIATFPSRHYDIEQYPAVKKHFLTFDRGRLIEAGREDLLSEQKLNQFCKGRLEQTGRDILVDGEKIIIGGKVQKSRKQTGNKWFETQDQIGYWDDFSLPKIIYPNMTKYMPFVYDSLNFTTNQKCFIITGRHVAYLTAFFNSSLFKYCFRDNFPELQGGTRELSKIFFDKIPVPDVDEETNIRFEHAVTEIQEGKCRQLDKEKLIDGWIFDLYGLSEVERRQIGFYEII